MSNSNSSVKVSIRARPFIKRELGSESHWELETHQIHLKPGKEKVRSYIFDRVFSEEETTNDVYEEIAQPIVNAAMEGFNGTIFAYGQTSSGKTYTMLGSSSSPGIIPLAIQEIFETIEKTPEREFLLRVSYLEIYNENLKDLLADAVVPLQIREDEFKSVQVAGLKEELVTSPNDVMQLMSKGEKQRQMAATNLNERSSRSHTIFRIIIESRERVELNRTREGDESAVRVAQLNLVDLAGSERASQSGAEGQRFKEGCHINKSLMILGQVINQICKENEGGSGSTFKSFRDSKLTRILQSSLGGNSLTSIICTATLAVIDETDSTLRFASSAKQVRNKPIVNEVLSDDALLYRQKREINQLKKKIEEMERHQVKDQQGDFDNLLAEKALLEDKNEKLTRILLVSSLPADHVKKKNLRRETWCPGANSRKTKMDWLLSPLKKKFVADDFSAATASFAANLEANEMSRIFETPGLMSASKRPFDTSSISADSYNKRARFFESNDDMSACLRRSVDSAVSDPEKEKLKLEVRQLSSQVKLQEETMEQFLKEQSSDEEEKAKLQETIEKLSQQIVHLERRDIERSEGDTYLKSLQLQVQDLHGQLRDSCRENRRLQEQCDAELDQSRELRSSVEKMNEEMTIVRKEAESKVEQCKEKMSLLQTQLEASMSSTKPHDVTLKLEREVESLKSELDEKNNLVSEMEKQTADLQREMNELKDSCEKSVSDLKSELEEAKAGKALLSETLHTSYDGEKTNCLVEAIQQCERLIEEKESTKAKFDLLTSKLTESKQKEQTLQDDLESKNTEIKSLKEQIEFDVSEKEILLQEEEQQLGQIKALEVEVEMLKNQLAEASKHPEDDVTEPKAESKENSTIVNDETLEEKSVCDKLEEELVTLREEVAVTSRNSHDSQALVQDLRQKLSGSGDEVERLCKENEQLRIKQSSLEKQLKASQADLESYLAMGDVSRRKSSIVRSPVRDAVNPVVEETLEKLQASQEEVEQLLKKIEESDVDAQNVRSDLQNKVDEVESLMKKLEECEVTMQDLKKELQIKSERLCGIENDRANQVEDIKEKDELISQLKEEIITTQLQLETQMLASQTAETESANQIVDNIDRAERFEKLDAQLQEKLTEIDDVKKLLENETNLTSRLKTELQEERLALEKLQEKLANVEKDRSYSRQSANFSDNDIRNELANCRSDIAKLCAENARLKEKAEQSKGALLAESNKELDIEKQLLLADQMQKDSIESFALQRNAANKEIAKLLKQVEDTQQALQKALSEKDIAQHQFEKQQAKCNDLKQQLLDLEKDQSRQYQGSFFTQSGGDAQKLSAKVKQLTFNLDLTNQKMQKLESSNKELLDEKRRMESELQRTRQVQSDSKDLDKIIASKTESIHRLQSELEQQKVFFRDAGTEAEKQKRSVEVLLERKETECQQVKDDLEKLEAVVKSLKLENESIEGRKQKVDNELQDALTRLSQDDSTLLQKDEFVAKLQHELDEVIKAKGEELKQKEEEICRFKENLKEMEEVVTNLRSEKESVNEAKRDVDLQLQHALDQLSNAKDLLAENEQLKSKLEQTQDVVNSVTAEVNQLAELQIAYDVKNAECASLLNKIQYLDARLEEIGLGATGKTSSTDPSCPDTPDGSSRDGRVVSGDTAAPKHVRFALSDCEDVAAADELEKLRAELDTERDQRANVEQELAEMRSLSGSEVAPESDTLEREEKLEVELSAEKNAKETLQLELAGMRSTLALLQSQLASDTSDDGIEEIRQQFDAEKLVSERLRQELTDLRSSVDQAKQEHMKMLEGQEHLSESEKNFVTLYHEFTQLSENMQQLSEVKDSLDQQLRNLQLSLEKSTSENEHLENRCSELSAEMEYLRTDAFNTQLSRLSLEEELSAANIKVAEYQLIITQLQARMDNAILEHDTTSTTLREAYNQTEEDLAEARSQVEVLQSELAAVKKETTDSQSPPSTEIDFANGQPNDLESSCNDSLMNKPVADDLKRDVQQLKELLASEQELVVSKSQEIERLTSEMKSNDEHFRMVQSQLLENVEELKVTLASEQDLLKSKSEEIAQLKQNVAEKCEEIGVLETAMKNKMETLLEEKEQALLQQRTELDHALEKIKSFEEQPKHTEGDDDGVHSNCNQRLSNLQEEIDVQSLELRRSKDETDFLRSKLTEKEEQLTSLQNDLDRLQQELNNHALTAATSGETAEQNASVIAGLKAQVSELKDTVQSTSEKLSSCLEELNCQKEAHQVTLSQLEDARRCMPDYRRPLLQALTDKEHLSDAEKNFLVLYEDFTQQSQACTEHCLKLDAAYSELGKVEAALAENTETVEKLQNQCENVTQQKVDLESDLLELQKEKDDLASRSETERKESMEKISELQSCLEKEILAVKTSAQKCEEVGAEVEQVMEKLDAEKSLATQLQSRNDVLLQEAERSANSLQELEKKCKELEEEKKSATSAQIAAQQEVQFYVEHGTDVKELKEVNLCMSERVVELELQLSNAKETLSDVQRENAKLKEKVSMLNEDLSSSKANMDGFEQALENAIEQSKAEIETLAQEKVQPLQEALGTAKKQLEDKEEEVVKLNKQLKELDEEFDVCARKKLNLDKKIHEMDKDFEEIEDENDELKAKVIQCEKENGTLKQHVKKLMTQLKLAATSSSRTTRSSSSSGPDADVVKLQEQFKTALSTYEHQLTSLQKKLKLSETKVEEMKARVSEQTSPAELQRLKTELEDAKKHLEDKQQEINRVKNELKTTNKEFDVCANKKLNLDKKIHEMDRDFEKIEDENDELKEKIAQQDKEVKHLQDWNQKLKEKLESAPPQAKSVQTRSSLQRGSDEERMVKLKAASERLLKKESDLQEKLKLSETKIFRLKEQLRMQNTQQNESIGNGRTSKQSIASGGIVQLTKLDIQERDMTRLKSQLQYTEKELAKYKDVEVKRRGENQELLDQNNKLRKYLKKLRDQSSLPAASESVLQPVSTNAHAGDAENQEDVCKTQ